MKTLSAILIIIIFLLVPTNLPFAMKASSDTKPAKYVTSRGKTQINYNIHQVDVVDINGKTRKIWDYDYVDIEGIITKAKFKESLRKQDLAEEEKEAWEPDTAVLEYKNEKDLQESLK